MAADNGMVVSSHHIASEAGIKVLLSGDNAVDAAIALAATLSSADNIGGGGFPVYHGTDGFVTTFSLEIKHVSKQILEILHDNCNFLFKASYTCDACESNPHCSNPHCYVIICKSNSASVLNCRYCNCGVFNRSDQFQRAGCAKCVV